MYILKKLLNFGQFCPSFSFKLSKLEPYFGSIVASLVSSLISPIFFLIVTKVSSERELLRKKNAALSLVFRFSQNFASFAKMNFA